MSTKQLAQLAVEDLAASRAASPKGIPPAAIPPPGPGAPPPPVPAPVSGGNAAAIDNALSALLQYIPTEATVIYLATMSAVPAIGEAVKAINPTNVYWGFVLGLTPLLFILLYYNQLARSGEPFPGFAEFPWFRFIASGIAFACWALCVPGGPYTEQPGYGVLWSILAIIVAVLLPLIENIYSAFQRK